MKHLYQLVSIMLVFSYFPLAAQAKGMNFTAHEWGTFTSLVGSNGRTVDGMYHEDEPLPNFVHGFGELVSQPIFQPDPDDECRFSKIPCEYLRRNAVTQKMETPVIYFYNNESTPLNVTVDVRFPQGAISETYPGPTFTTPTRNTEPVLANGHTVFGVQVYPLGVKPADLDVPYVEPGNIYGHARHVDSSLVRAHNEMEKFIFYRGVGQFQPEMEITSSYDYFYVRPAKGTPMNGQMFLIDVNNEGEIRAYNMNGFISKGYHVMSKYDLEVLRNHSRPFERDVLDRKLVMSQLHQELTRAGLTDQEASSMINTWEHGYFRVPGLRLLYILPRAEVEKILPMNITPSPTDLVRVFVGRIEVMLASDESTLVGQVITAGDLIDVEQIGRFAESKLRRAFEVYMYRGEYTNPDPRVIATFERLIQRAKSIGLN